MREGGIQVVSFHGALQQIHFSMKKKWLFRHALATPDAATHNFRAGIKNETRERTCYFFLPLQERRFFFSSPPRNKILRQTTMSFGFLSATLTWLFRSKHKVRAEEKFLGSCKFSFFSFGMSELERKRERQHLLKQQFSILRQTRERQIRGGAKLETTS